MSVLKRNNVRVSGSGDQAIVFAHGFGCDQSMWKYVAPSFEATHRVVLYDLMGAGNSDLSAYDFQTYSDLAQHGEDLINVCDALDLDAPIVVGHSVSAITAALAAISRPERFSKLVMVAPSPCFINDATYQGGFNREDLLQVIEYMQENYLGWAEHIAPTIAGEDAEGSASKMLTQSFCRTNPDIARHFGHVTFLSDKRSDMARVKTPTLVLQCSQDALAPVSVGEWMQKTLPMAKLEVLDTVGHCPHLTAPEATVAAIRRYLEPEPVAA